MRSSPTLTAAAQPGVSSSQHSSAGQCKHGIRVALTSHIGDVSCFAFTHPEINMRAETVNSLQILDRYVNYAVSTAYNKTLLIYRG